MVIARAGNIQWLIVLFDQRHGEAALEGESCAVLDGGLARLKSDSLLSSRGDEMAGYR